MIACIHKTSEINKWLYFITHPKDSVFSLCLLLGSLLGPVKHEPWSLFNIHFPKSLPVGISSMTLEFFPSLLFFFFSVFFFLLMIEELLWPAALARHDQGTVMTLASPVALATPPTSISLPLRAQRSPPASQLTAFLEEMGTIWPVIIVWTLSSRLLKTTVSDFFLSASCCGCSVTKSYPTLCDPTDGNTPRFSSSTVSRSSLKLADRREYNIASLWAYWEVLDHEENSWLESGIRCLASLI